MRKWVNWSIFAGLGVTLAVGVMVFHYCILPIALRYQVRKVMALENGTQFWEWFQVTPIPLKLKLHFFKVDNPEEMLKGAKPKLTQFGPFVYLEHWKKQEVRVNDQLDTISYRQGIEFVFDREGSGNLSDTEPIVIVNPIVHILAEVINRIPTVELVEELLEFGLEELMGANYGPTLTTTARAILFDGMPVPCSRGNLTITARLFCSALGHFQPTPIIRKAANGDIVIALLRFKKLGPVLEVGRGLKQDNLGKIVSVDGLRKLDTWWCDSANTVDGYDLVLLPSFLTKDSAISLYTPELRTSVQAVYKEDTSYAGIDGYRFGLTWSILGDPQEDKEARCYCPGSVKGLTEPRPCWQGKGIVDLSSCLEIPALLSLPHFYRASDNYLSMVDGLDPDPNLHDSYLDLEPTTGVPLRGYKRAQINVWATNLPALRKFKNHATAMLPLVWFEEGTELGEEQIALIRDQLLKVMYIEMMVKWTLFSAGIAIAILGTGMAIWNRKQDLTKSPLNLQHED